MKTDTGKIDFMFRPKSVAVIGASSTSGKVGFAVMNSIQDSGYKGKVFPINPGAAEILGFKAYKSISDVPEPVELAVICVPAKAVNPIAEECGKKGIKGLIVITAGFKEIGGEGKKLESDLVEIIRTYNMRLCGPNCLGIISPGNNFSFAKKTPRAGDVAIISQSGAMLTGLMDWSLTSDVGFSACVSLGNNADLDVVDFIDYLAEDPSTKIIIAYIESIRDGNKFFNVVPKAARKKPIVLIKSGTSEAGAQAASSHTGALAGSDIAFDIAFRKSGVIRANTISDLFNFALVFRMQPIPKGNKFAIVTNAGGPGIVCTDAFEKNKLGFASFSTETLTRLSKVLPAESNIHNPIDIIGDAPPQRYYDALNNLFEATDEEVAGSIVILTPQAQTNPPEAARKLILIKQKYPSKVLVGAFIGGLSMVEPIKILRDASIPCYSFPEEAVQAIKGLDRYRELVQQPLLNDIEVKRYPANNERIRQIIEEARCDDRTALLSYEKSEIFDILNIKNPKSKLAKTARDAVQMANEIGYPVVAKVVSPQIVHKFDIGGVILNIQNEEEVRDAFIRIMKNAKEFGPKNAQIYGVEIQEMIDFKKMGKTHELILGMARDPQWGPLMMVGSGGIYANYVKDVAFDLSYKFTESDAWELLKQTKIYNILKGVRGEPRSNIEMVIDTLCKIAQLVNDFEDIMELDINPLLVYKDGVNAVDIKITIKR
jgi:acetyl coenzyme A synthetase (ADP forming)-like protein